MNTQEHWNKIYATKAENEVSWFQSYPKTSIELLEQFNLPLTANIIDIGGGNSHFVDVLLQKGYQNIWVLDISANAIDVAKDRLGEEAKKIHWIVSDVTEFDFTGLQFDLWHDRAAFHFLTTTEKVDTYILAAGNAVMKNGYLVVGTFSEQGPKKCSGLEIKQYSESSISSRFDFGFNKIKCLYEDHTTPFRTIQNFLFCSFKRK